MKKFLAIILTATMLFCMIPAIAVSAEDQLNYKEISDVSEIFAIDKTTNSVINLLAADGLLGRGILRNPCLLDQIQQNGDVDYGKIRLFHEDVLNGYTEAFSGDKPVLFKMKELWSHMLALFPQGDNYAKKIRKAERISEYKTIAAQLFDSVCV